MYSKLEQYPRLLTQVEASRCQVHQFGGFQIHRLDPEGRCTNRNPSTRPGDAGGESDGPARDAPRQGTPDGAKQP
jgi:hypothetical protein